MGKGAAGRGGEELTEEARGHAGHVRRGRSGTPTAQPLHPDLPTSFPDSPPRRIKRRCTAVHGSVRQQYPPRT